MHDILIFKLLSFFVPTVRKLFVFRLSKSIYSVDNKFRKNTHHFTGRFPHWIMKLIVIYHYWHWLYVHERKSRGDFHTTLYLYIYILLPITFFTILSIPFYPLSSHFIPPFLLPFFLISFPFPLWIYRRILFIQ